MHRCGGLTSKSSAMLLAVADVIADWNPAAHGSIFECTAVWAWQKRVKFDPGKKGEDRGGVRILAQLLTNLPPNRASEIAIALTALPEVPSKKLKRKLAKAGGVHTVNRKVAKQNAVDRLRLTKPTLKK